MVRRVRVRTPATPPSPTVHRGAATARASVTVEKAHRGKVYDTEYKSTEAHKEPADLRGRVRIGGGVTINMGDFESVRVHVELELACENTVDGLRSTHELVSPLLDEIIMYEKALATGQN